LATTSEGLASADLAWHALNTDGWDGEEVVERGETTPDYFVIICASAKKPRVYPRKDRHPRITNLDGGYK